MVTPYDGWVGRSSEAAIVVPFPRVRHLGFVSRHAVRMVELPPATAEKHLARQLEVQRETMIRRGIATASIDHELEALELAIRAVAWRISSMPGGAAG